METTFSAEEVNKFEREVWSRCARRYMDTFGLLTGEAIQPLLDVASITDGSRVLDVGTGPGNAAVAVQKRGGAVIGIDFSASMLSEARQNYPNIEFKEANGDQLPFDDGEFDAVVSNLAVHHMARPNLFLSEARRVLRDGGKIAFTVWSNLEKLEAFGLFFGAVQAHAEAVELPHGPLFGVSDFDVFRSMLQEAGFRESQVIELKIAWRMTNINPLLDGFVDWSNMTTFPNTMREAIESSVREASVAYENNGQLVIPNPVILVSATR